MKTHRMLGIAVTWRRAAIAILLLVAFIALATYAPSRVHVQPATGPVPLRRFGFDSAATFLGVKEAEIEAKIIATVTGSLWEWTGVRMQLFFIRSGVPQGDKCRVGMGTNSGRLDHPFYRYRMNARVALGRAYTKQGSFAFLESSASGGSVGPTHAPGQPAKVTRGYERNLAWSRREIVYVEGSEEPTISPGMSLEEFCNENNRGEFLVVIAWLD
jgi:hypothetical protein